MDSLPKELHLEIFSHLSHNDQLSISNTCRSFSYLVKPLLFSVLVFAGQAQRDYFDHGVNIQHHGRKKTVDLTQLDDAVDEILSLGIAPFVKEFRFKPFRYAFGK